jgi:hypothetical protein
MKNPTDIGDKIIDAAKVHCVKPLTPERTAGLTTEKHFKAEIRAIGGAGGFVEYTVSDIVAAFEQFGEKLTMVDTGEAIRAEWIMAITAFSDRPGVVKKFGSVVQMRHPDTGEIAKEWLLARPEQIPGGNAPKLASFIGKDPRQGPA